MKTKITGQMILIAAMILCLGIMHETLFAQDYGTSLEVQAEEGKYANSPVKFTARYTKTGGYDIPGMPDSIGRTVWRNEIGSIGLYRLPEQVRFFEQNGDGKKDEVVLVKNYGIYAFKPDGALIWQTTGSTNIPYLIRSVEVFDPNYDGIDDIMVYGEKVGNLLVVIDGRDGSVKWSAGLGRDDAEVYSRQAAIGDFDGDGKKDDIAMTFRNYPWITPITYYVRVYTTNDGNSWALKWENTANDPGEVKEIAVSDINDDGIDDVICVGPQQGLSAYNGSNGNLFWNVDKGERQYSVAALDADHDGKKQEFVLSSEYNLWWINKQGVAYQSAPIRSQYYHHELLALDIDGDGFKDDVVVPETVYAGAAYVSAFNENGVKLWEIQLPEPAGSLICSIWADDVNGDGREEILLGATGTDNFYCLDKSGNILWSYKLRGDTGDIFGPQPSIRASDINHDGIKEIAVASGGDTEFSFVDILQDVMCKISFSDNGQETQMQWNPDTMLWEFTRPFPAGSYSWQVRCTKGGYVPALSTGNIDILPDINPPVVTLGSPQEQATFTTDRTPDFVFNITDPEQATLDITLFLDDGKQVTEFSRPQLATGAAYIITPEFWLPDGNYQWWITCFDGNNTVTTQRRSFTLQVPYYPLGNLDLSLWPAWAFIKPTNIIHAYADDNVHDMMKTLQPGDKLIIHEGTYSTSAWYQLELHGTASAPIFIEGAAGENVIITRPDAGQNNINIGNSEYLSIRNIEFVGGSRGIRLFAVNNFIVEDCEVHSMQEVAISANSDNTSYLYFMHNNVYDTGGTGEGFYLGANYSAKIMHHSVIYNNLIHDTCTHNTGNAQGDGIEVKQGSYANLIKDNVIYNVKCPGVIVYGTDGHEQNIIEGNIVINSADNGIQAQGEAIVRNNIVINSAYSGLDSKDHQGTATNLQVLNNTFISNPYAGVYIRNFTNRENMVLANNIIYSPGHPAIRIGTGDDLTGAGGLVQGNIVLGSFPASAVISGGVQLGNSIEQDFVNPGELNYYPKNQLFANRDQVQGLSVGYDFQYQARGPKICAGAFEKTNDVGYPIQRYFKYPARKTTNTVVYGDVSGNGEISAADASLAAQYAVGLITLTPEQITKADVSGNGEVSAADASLIAQKAVGLIDKFPVEQ